MKERSWSQIVAISLALVVAGALAGALVGTLLPHGPPIWVMFPALAVGLIVRMAMKKNSGS